MDRFGEKVSFIWSVVDLLRETHKQSEVILPLVLLRWQCPVDAGVEASGAALDAGKAR